MEILSEENLDIDEHEVENTIDAIFESSQVMPFSKEKVFGNELVNELLYASDILADQIDLEPFGSSELRSLEGQIERKIISLQSDGFHGINKNSWIVQLVRERAQEFDHPPCPACI